MNSPKVIANGNDVLAVLWHGDCYELLAQGKFSGADAIVSDPPYGINFTPGYRKTTRITELKNCGKIIGDDKPFDPEPWVRMTGYYDNKKNYESPLPIALFGADRYIRRLPDTGTLICWDKACGKGAAAQFRDADYIWCNREVKRNVIHHFSSGVFKEGEECGQKRVHISQKPISVMIQVIELCRIGIGKTILDPYMGSGSTGVAAIRTGRRFIGAEIDKAHFENAVRRIEEEARNLGLFFGNVPEAK